MMPQLSKGKRAILIAFEGLPGAGKSTQAEPLRDWIAKSYNKRVSITRAFGDLEKSTLEQFQKNLHIDEDGLPMMFAFQALHSRHYEVTVASLKEHDVVIVDCWRYPFIAYHSLYGELARMEPAYITMLDSLAYRRLIPDLTLHFVVDPGMAHSRYTKREAITTSPIRRETLVNLAELAKFYLEASIQEGWTQIDANRSPPSEVTNEIQSRLVEYFSSCLAHST